MADENFFLWIDICAIQINKYHYYYGRKFAYNIYGDIFFETIS